MFDWIVTVIALSMVAYHMLTTHYLFLGTYEHQTVHLFFILLLTFLSTIQKKKGKGIVARQVILIILSCVATGYVLLNIDYLEGAAGFPSLFDIVVGVLLVILVIEGTRQSWGITLPIVSILFVAYFFLGHLIPGPLYHEQFSLGYIISYLSIGLSGIFGTFLSASANQVFLFVVFGGLMEVIKINDFFFEMGKWTGRYLQGGPGQTAVVSSSLVGMVTGAAVANVVITGSFTIPYMKRVGYRPEIAGAIEATASTGGQLMPPVMGASAFVMAFLLGVPYATVMFAAILPAIFYYWGVALGVQFIAVSDNIIPPQELPDKKLIYRRMPLFLVPLATVIILLFLRFSPNYAAFWAILAAIGLSFIGKDTRPTPSSLAKALAKGGAMGAQIGISLALVGLMAQTLITTGLGNKITHLVLLISGGDLLVTLILTMVVSLILGCGVPTVAAYSLVALTVVPSLIDMGVLPIAAHFFAFYFAIISALTPPVALAAMAGAGIAGASYFKTGMQAFKLAISGFIIPYLIVYNPILILHVKSVIWAVGSMIAIPIGLTTLTAFIYGCGLTRFSNRERLICLASTIMSFGYCVFRHIEDIPFEYPMLGLGIFLFVVLLMMQIKKKRKIQFLEKGAG